MIIRKDVIKLTVPVLMEQTFIVLMGAVNTIMAGHIGKEAISAVGMIDSINNMFIAFLSALAVGGTVVVAQYTGRENSGASNEAVRQALFSGVGLSICITVLLAVFRIQVVSLLYGKADVKVITDALTYFNITLLTYPLIAATSISCGVLRGAGDTRTPMKITVFMNILNVILGYILIYGLYIGNSHFHIRIPGFGILGAALAIGIARSLGAAVSLFILINGSRLVKLPNMRDFRIDTGIQRSIFYIGIPAGLESLVFNSGKLITQVFIIGMGTATIAANYIAGSIFTLMVIPGISFSIAATTMVGQAMGKGDINQAKKVLMHIMKISTIGLVSLGVIVLLLSRFLVSLYTRDAEITGTATTLVTAASVFNIFWSVSFVLPAGFKGAGDARYTMLTTLLGMWVFRIILGYTLGIPLHMGVLGVWLGMFSDWIVRGALYLIRLRGKKWMEHQVITGTRP